MENKNSFFLHFHNSSLHHHTTHGISTNILTANFFNGSKQLNKEMNQICKSHNLVEKQITKPRNAAKRANLIRYDNNNPTNASSNHMWEGEKKQPKPNRALSYHAPSLSKPIKAQQTPSCSPQAEERENYTLFSLTHSHTLSL